jgi:hypothetical protein
LSTDNTGETGIADNREGGGNTGGGESTGKPTGGGGSVPRAFSNGLQGNSQKTGGSAGAGGSFARKPTGGGGKSIGGESTDKPKSCGKPTGGGGIFDGKLVTGGRFGLKNGCLRVGSLVQAGKLTGSAVETIGVGETSEL